MVMANYLAAQFLCENAESGQLLIRQHGKAPRSDNLGKYDLGTLFLIFNTSKGWRTAAVARVMDLFLG